MKPQHLICILLFIFGTAHSCSYVMVTDERMVQTADVIIEGQVLSRGPALYSNIPATEYTVTITDRIQATDDIGSSVVVTVPGGFDPNNHSISLHINGAPVFAIGETVLLFLVHHKDRLFIQHLTLGAFHEVQGANVSFASRAIDDRENGKVRDFNLFKQFIKSVLNESHKKKSTDYYVESDSDAAFLKLKSRYNLFVYDGYNVRWFDFDEGKTVTFQTYGEQAGIVGGGMVEIDEGMSGWNNDPSTPISYARQGTTDSTDGLTFYDNVNSIVFGDPTDYIPGPFDCATGGLLAMGGYWTVGDIGTFRGIEFVKITYGDVVIQDGIECWFNGASSPENTLNALLAHELGHTLGLLHSCGDDASGSCAGRPDQDNALMRSYIGYNRGPIPNIDDINAITYLYSPTGTIISSMTGIFVFLIYVAGSTETTGTSGSSTTGGTGTSGITGTTTGSTGSTTGNNEQACTSVSPNNLGNSFTDTFTCCYAFNNPSVPTFSVPAAGGSDHQLNPENPIILFNGTALTSGCNGQTFYYETTPGVYTQTYIGSDGNVRNGIDVFYASYQDKINVRTIQSWQSNLKTVLDGKNALMFITCDNGLSSCIRFKLD